MMIMFEMYSSVSVDILQVDNNSRLVCGPKYKNILYEIASSSALVKAEGFLPMLI